MAATAPVASPLVERPSGPPLHLVSCQTQSQITDKRTISLQVFTSGCEMRREQLKISWYSPCVGVVLARTALTKLC